MKKLLVALLFLFAFTACNKYEYVMPTDGIDGIDGVDGVDGTNGFNALWKTALLLPGQDESYPAGGFLVTPGWDTDGDGVQDIEQENGKFIVSNGLDGETPVGAPIPVFEIRECTLYQDGVALGYVCGLDGTNGTNGSNGEDGEDGADGLIRIPFPLVTEIPPTEIHLNGGWLYTWIYLNENLNIVEENPIMRAYPVYHGNNGINGTNGTNGETPYIGEDGYWYVGIFNTGWKAQGEKGDPGVPGADGETPYVGEDGFWWIGFINTGWKAQGEKGDPGAPGSNGLTPFIGENLNWWIGGFDTGHKAVGIDGEDGEDVKSPFIGENNYWYVWSDNEGSYINTNIYSIGQPGETGTQGIQGEPGPAGGNGETPYIGGNGNWWIASADTGFPSQGIQGPIGPQGVPGIQGPQGDHGLSPFIGFNGNWWIWINIGNFSIPIDSRVGAQGTAGPQGEQGIPGVSVVDIDIVSVGARCQDITINLSDNTSYTFTVCDGEDGISPEVGVNSGGCVSLSDVYLVREDFDTETLPYGWEGEAGRLYDFIPNRLVVKANTYLKTSEFLPTSLIEISIDAVEYKTSNKKWIEAIVIDSNGSETSLGSPILVTQAHNNSLEPSQTIRWINITGTDIVRVKFVFTTDATQHNKQKVVIDNLNVIGNITYCIDEEDPS